MKKPQPQFELVKSADNETEKRIEAHAKGARLAIAGNRRARNLFFAYAALGGAHAEAIMQLCPHGHGEKRLEQIFGEDHRTIQNWRRFARNLMPQLKGETVSLLTAPTIGKKTIPAKIAEAIQTAVLDVMDGQGMVEFMQACKALREPKQRGGDHSKPDPEDVKKFCAECHPDMPTAQCQALKTPALKREFRAWEANQCPPEAEDDRPALLAIDDLYRMKGNIVSPRICKIAVLKDWIEASEGVTRFLKEALQLRKEQTK